MPEWLGTDDPADAYLTGWGWGSWLLMVVLAATSLAAVWAVLYYLQPHHAYIGGRRVSDRGRQILVVAGLVAVAGFFVAVWNMARHIASGWPWLGFWLLVGILVAAVLFVATGDLYGAAMWSAAGAGVGPAIVIFLIDGLHRAAASFSVSVGGFMLAGLAVIGAAIVLAGGLWIRNALQRNGQW